MTSRFDIVLGMVALVASACGSSDLEEAEHVRTWATTGSAVAVYAHAYEPIALADGRRPFADPDCPATQDDGTTLTITGGCTDAAGWQWVGDARVVRSGDDRTLTADGFGHFEDPGMRAELSGTIQVRQIGAGSHAFDVDLVHEGGLTTTLTYSGTVEGGYDTATTWNGSGEIEREGLVAPTGTVEVTTVDEVMDDAVCANQPVSGETRIDDGEQTAFVRYDGATDCDDDHTARWGVDGDERGSIDGIQCAMSPGRAGRATSLLALVAVAGFVTARRARPTRRVRGGGGTH